MFNSEWNKGMIMAAEDKIELHELRITILEKNAEKLEGKIDTLIKGIGDLSNRLAVVPSGGLQCALHQERMSTFSTRLNDVEEELKGISKKVIKYSAIAATVLFLISNLVIPYVLSNFKIHPIDDPQTHSELQTPYFTHPTNRFGDPQFDEYGLKKI